MRRIVSAHLRAVAERAGRFVEVVGRSWAVWLAAMGCPASGCTAAGSPPDPPSEEPMAHPVRIPVSAPIVTFDPHLADDAVSRVVANAVFDTVVDWRNNDSLGSGGVNEHLEATLLSEMPRFDTQNSRWELIVRPPGNGRVFLAGTCLSSTNGRQVVASDVAASWRRVFSLHRGHLFGPSVLSESAVSADDNRGVVFLETNGFDPWLPHRLANPQLSILPAECIRAEVFSHGSGDFLLDLARSEIGTRAVLLPATPQQPTVQLEYFRSSLSAYRLFQQGKLDVLIPSQAEFSIIFDGDIPRSGKVPKGTQVQRTEIPGTTLLLFNLNGPLHRLIESGDDLWRVALRKKIFASFDAEAYHRVIRNGTWSIPATSLVPPSLRPPNMHGAKADQVTKNTVGTLDKDASVARPGGAPRTIRYATGVGVVAHQEVALLRESLKPKSVMLDVTYDEAYLGRLISDGRSSTVDLFSLRLDADYPSETYFYQAFTCTGDVARIIGYCDASFDRLYATYATQISFDRRAARVTEHKLATKLEEAAIVLAIDHPQQWMLRGPRIESLQRHPFSGIRLETLRVQAPAGRPNPVPTDKLDAIGAQ